MGLPFKLGKFDLSDYETGALLVDLIDDGFYTSFEQFEDETSPITGIRVFDIVTVIHEGQAYHLARMHDGFNNGSPHVSMYVNQLYIYENLYDAEVKLQRMIDEFLEFQKTIIIPGTATI